MKTEELVGVTVEAQVRERRVKRAEALASAGLVNRDKDRFLVSSKGLALRSSPYEVRRDEEGRIRCSCLEFAERIEASPGFRCEHILAVKFAIASKNTEPVTKRRGAVQTENDNASESSLLLTQQQSDPEEAAAPVNCFAAEKDLSGDGEQVYGGDLADGATDGPVVTGEADFLLTANLKGEVEMTNESIVMTAGKPDVSAEADLVSAQRNVLAFAQPQKSPAAVVKCTNSENSRQAGEGPDEEFCSEAPRWELCVAALDGFSADWSQTIRDVQQMGDFFVVTVRIDIGGISREGIGTGFSDSADGVRIAELRAFRHAAMKFAAVRRTAESLGREDGLSVVNRRVFPANPMARSLSDLVSAKQLGMIRAVAREIGIDASAECYRLVTCRPDELSRDAASLFIDHLAEIRAAGTAFDASARRAI